MAKKKKTIRQRVDEYEKKNPGKTAKDIALVLGCHAGTVAQARAARRAAGKGKPAGKSRRASPATVQKTVEKSRDEEQAFVLGGAAAQALVIAVNNGDRRAALEAAVSLHAHAGSMKQATRFLSMLVR